MADQRPIGYWLKLVDGLIDERFARTLDEHGVTRRQWQLLDLLARGPAGIEALDAELAPFLAVVPPSDPQRDGVADSSAAHLAELVESGWVETVAEGFALTERGQVARTRLAAVVAVQRDAATEGVTGEEYTATLDVLARIARNLGADV